MSNNIKSILTDAALARLERLQRSPQSRDFSSKSTIEAFSQVQSSVFAGKPHKRKSMTAAS